MSGTPPGWTEEKLQNATVDDLRQLPEETLHELDTNAMQNLEAITVVASAQLAHQQRVQREALGLPPAPSKGGPFDLVDGKAPKPVDSFVQVVEERGWDDFGFVLYRIDHTDDGKWQQWEKAFMEIIDQSIDESSGGEKVTDKCLIPINNDSTITLDSFASIQKDYKENTKAGKIVTDGLDHGLCLAADIDAVNSLLAPEAGVEPWVWLIDEHYDFSQIETIADDEYPGHFPIAIASLIPDLFPMVASDAMSCDELWACCSFDETHPVWTSPFEGLCEP